MRCDTIQLHRTFFCRFSRRFAVRASSPSCCSARLFCNNDSAQSALLLHNTHHLAHHTNSLHLTPPFTLPEKLTCSLYCKQEQAPERLRTPQTAQPARQCALAAASLAASPAQAACVLLDRLTCPQLSTVLQTAKLLDLAAAAAYHSIHMKLATACTGIAASCVHDPSGYLLCDVCQLCLQLFRLQPGQTLSVL